MESRDFVSELVVDQVAPVLDYARSMSTFVADTEGELDAVLEELERRGAPIAIATDGAFAAVRSAVRLLRCLR